MKRCPNCAEENQNAAIVCQRCGRIVVSDPRPALGGGDVAVKVVTWVIGAVLAILLLLSFLR
jgi:hypothetical protein